MKFTKEENDIILELARNALSDADTYQDIAEHLDLSDDVLKALQEKIEKATNSTVTEQVKNAAFITHNDDENLNANGTCLQGCVNTTYAALVNTFGEHTAGDAYKCDVEWVIKFADGNIATIYNYKDGKNYLGAEGLATEDITDWHIGGCSKKAVENVLKVLDIH